MLSCYFHNLIHINKNIQIEFEIGLLLKEQSPRQDISYFLIKISHCIL